MNRSVNFSVLVLYYQGESYLKACLASLLESVQPSDEIIVVVNNSNQAVHGFDAHSDRVNYLHVHQNIGYANAVNYGVASAKHEFVIIADHDLVFRPGWIEALWTLYISDTAIGAVSCKVLNTKSQRLLDYGIAYSDFNLGHPFMDLPADHPLVREDRIAQMVCAGGLLLRKKDLIRAGGFEGTFGALYTDLDVCLKLKRIGLTVAASSKAIAYHFGGDFSLINRAYKGAYLKADVKGAFMRKHADVLESDLAEYYSLSAQYFNNIYGNFDKYFFCNMMNVVNPSWYNDLLKSFGAEQYDYIHRPSGNRDADSIGLFEVLGYDIMALGVPIAYFVDRFVSLEQNAFWWNYRRNFERDIVVDRNANILPVSEVLDQGNG